MTDELKPYQIMHEGHVWTKVVYAADCGDPEDELLECHQCGGMYADCPCPGPTMDDVVEYTEINGHWYGREIEEDGSDTETS